MNFLQTHFLTAARLFYISALSACRAQAQTAPHWGVQGDYYSGNVPQQIVDLLNDLVEKPTIQAKAFNTGLVRFHNNGSPNWAVEFSKTQLSIEGSRAVVPANSTIPIAVAEVRGSGNIRGILATKYFNFFNRNRISAGLATGGGLGKLEANYYRYFVPPGSGVITGRESVDYIVPMFQIMAQADVRPVRWVSLSPFYGIRNGTYGFGGAVRIHFIK